MATWTITEDNIGWFGVLRDRRAVGIAPAESMDEAISRVQRNIRYRDSDRIEVFDVDGRSVHVSPRSRIRTRWERALRSRSRR